MAEPRNEAAERLECHHPILQCVICRTEFPQQSGLPAENTIERHIEHWAVDESTPEQGTLATDWDGA